MACDVCNFSAAWLNEEQFATEANTWSCSNEGRRLKFVVSMSDSQGLLLCIHAWVDYARAVLGPASA